MIISDIVWADIVSWLHARGLMMTKIGNEYRVYIPEALANELSYAKPQLGCIFWADDGVSVRSKSLHEALGFVLKIMSHKVGAK